MCRKWQERLRAYVCADDGASAVEYALLVAGIFLAIVSVVFLLGNSLNSLYDKGATQFADAVQEGGR